MNEIYVHVTGVVATDVTGKLVDDVPLASFRLVSTARRFDRNQQTWVDGEKVWLTVTCWRSLARNVIASVLKTERVIVCGRLKVSEWRDSEGRLRSRTEIIADSVGHDLTFGTSVHTRAHRVETLVNGTKDLAAAKLADVHERQTDGLDARALEDLMNGVQRPLSSPDPLTSAEDAPGAGDAEEDDAFEEEFGEDLDDVGYREEDDELSAAALPAPR